MDFLVDILWKRRRTPRLHNQVYQELWKDLIQKYSIGLLGIDSLEKEEDATFTQPGVPIKGGVIGEPWFPISGNGQDIAE